MFPVEGLQGIMRRRAVDSKRGGLQHETETAYMGIVAFRAGFTRARGWDLENTMPPELDERGQPPTTITVLLTQPCSLGDIWP